MIQINLFPAEIALLWTTHVKHEHQRALIRFEQRCTVVGGVS